MSVVPNWIFLIDENADFRLKRDLRAAGFVGPHVHATDVGLGGLPDSMVFAYAKTHQMILLTIDQDFLSAQQYPPPHAGIVVVRVSNARTFRQDVITGLLTLASQTNHIANTVYVIDPGGGVRQYTWYRSS